MNKVLHSSSGICFILSELDQRINTFRLDPYASQLDVAYLTSSSNYLLLKCFRLDYYPSLNY